MTATTASRVPTSAQRRWRRAPVLGEARRVEAGGAAGSSAVTARPRQSEKGAPSPREAGRVGWRTDLRTGTAGRTSVSLRRSVCRAVLMPLLYAVIRRECKPAGWGGMVTCVTTCGAGCGIPARGVAAPSSRQRSRRQRAPSSDAYMPARTAACVRARWHAGRRSVNRGGGARPPSSPGRRSAPSGRGTSAGRPSRGCPCRSCPCRGSRLRRWPASARL